MKFSYTLKISSASQVEADKKANALAKLAGQFDAKTLNALATKGKGFIQHSVYGPMIQKELGL